MSELDLAREDLSAALRVAAAMGLNEGICNHFSVALKSDEERYLINPYGVHWSEMHPDHLVLIDGDGTVLEGEGEVEATSRFIHEADHRDTPRRVCV